MFRKLLSLMLLVPLSLNGLWMVCSEANAAEPSATHEPSAVAALVCAGNSMCPLHKPAAKADTPDNVGDSASDDHAISASADMAPGAICLISPDGTGVSIAAIGFVYAPPVAAQAVVYNEQTSSIPVAAANCAYCDALLIHATPPPRA